ncbi:hypothetical protein Pelo_17552 [Pelomyxa schiedti]|nr:hypothetical protein Pelo_17552 [Pelomyxa schiedti]
MLTIPGLYATDYFFIPLLLQKSSQNFCVVTFYFKHGTVVSGGYASVWRMCIIRNVSFLANPLRWLVLISEIKANITIAPPFAYQLASTLLPTGDSVSAALLEKYRQSFSVCHLKRNVLLPMYIIAEATFLVSMHLGLNASNTPHLALFMCATLPYKNLKLMLLSVLVLIRSVVSCGTPTPPATSVCIVFEERSLSTGDAGFIHDDKLFVLGRLCDVICLEDISSLSGIADSAAFVVEEDGKNTVVAEASPEFSSPEMAIPGLAEIAHKVIEDLNLQIESILLVKQGVLRRTTGKIQRQMCLEDHRIFEEAKFPFLILQPPLLRISTSANPAGHHAPVTSEPTTIVGMSCRFPGAPGKEDYWNLMQLMASRYPVDLFYDPVPGTPGKLNYKEGGYITNVDLFDNRFPLFGFKN